MKNNELHTLLGALDAETPKMPVHQARLKQSLSRVQMGTHHKKEPFMKRNKKFIGLGSVGMTLAIIGSVLVYSYNYSPRALADEMIGRGMTHLSTLEPGKMSALQEQFGGDPAEALKEAKLAKDAKVITKEEFDEEQKNASGVFATSLSKDGTTFSMQSMKTLDGGEGGVSTMSIKGEAMAGTAATGSVNVKQGQVTMISGTSAAGAPPSGATITSGSTSTIAYSGGSAGASATSPVNTSTDMVVPADGKPMDMTVSSYGVGVNANGTTTTTTPVPSELPKDFKVVKIMSPNEATSFLRYTDKNGRVNVLSLDKEGLPIFRTIFMASGDLQTLPRL